MKRFLTFLLVLGFHSSLFAGDPPGNRYEQSLLETIKEIQSLDHEQALNSTRDLIKQYPHSRLGQMLYADLLLAKAEPLTEIGSGMGSVQCRTSAMKYDSAGNQYQPAGVGIRTCTRTNMLPGR